MRTAKQLLRAIMRPPVDHDAATVSYKAAPARYYAALVGYDAAPCGL